VLRGTTVRGSRAVAHQQQLSPSQDSHSCIITGTISGLSCAT
jgi:hypothetical protein